MSARATRKLVSALTDVAEEYAERLAAAGVSLDDVGGAESLAALVRTVLPRPNRFAARVGPVYGTGQLTRLLPGATSAPISDEAVRNRQRNRRLVGFKTADRKWAWPAWQFRAASGRLIVREDVIGLWQLLPADGPSELTRIAWMTGAHRDLEGDSPLQWLDRHGLEDRVRGVARRWAARVAA